ncbi:MAG: hypothetical protein LBU46_04080 [Candidatus Accumulibacter sp.]|jgi:hypothetical protein|nr:hypothetical protein [Accumulibacter sp.]
MKKQLIVTVALFLLGLVAVGDAFADRGRGRGHGWSHGHGHGHSRIGVGIVVGAPFWRPWHYPSYYHYPPVVIERQAPPVYIEQAPPVEIRTQTVYSGYWYYCQSPSGYYPEIRECPQGWVKIPPRP